MEEVKVKVSGLVLVSLRTVSPMLSIYHQAPTPVHVHPPPPPPPPPSPSASAPSLVVAAQTQRDTQHC